MRIILMRHGKPDLIKAKPLASHEFHQWIQAYNNAPLCAESTPSDDALKVANECAFVVCSHLRRSQESAQRLELTTAHSDENFREVDMPHGNLYLPSLSPSAWTVLFRCLWFMGYARNSETFHSAQVRASAGARQLHELAQQHGSVIFVGHGLFNRFVAKALLRNGWRGAANPGSGYWEFGIYEFS